MEPTHTSRVQRKLGFTYLTLCFHPLSLPHLITNILRKFLYAYCFPLWNLD